MKEERDLHSKNKVCFVSSLAKNWFFDCELKQLQAKLVFKS